MTGLETGLHTVEEGRVKRLSLHPLKGFRLTGGISFVSVGGESTPGSLPLESTPSSFVDTIGSPPVRDKTGDKHICLVSSEY